MSYIKIEAASENNLKEINISIKKNQLTVITGISGSGKSSLAFDTILAEAQRHFFSTLSHYSRQALSISSRPKVKNISGLSPAIGLAQNESLPATRTTIASMIDVQEILGIAFARFGEPHCPKHKEPTSGLTLEDLTQNIFKMYSGKLISICAPIFQKKKSSLKSKLESFSQRGFTKVIVNEAIYPLSTSPKFSSNMKHDLSLCIDFVKVTKSSKSRLIRSIETSLEEGNGVCEVFEMQDTSMIQGSRKLFSHKSGCKECGFTWPHLDSRHFSPGSLGKCPSCSGIGLVQTDPNKSFSTPCHDCKGTGIDARLEAIILTKWSMHQLLNLPIKNLDTVIKSIAREFKNNTGFQRVYKELRNTIDTLMTADLGYLSLSRKVHSLSSGEAQRIRLVSILNGSLRNIIYVLDEPSQGLHPIEISGIVRLLKDIISHGNTVICVDHDTSFMKAADWIIDLGPGGGNKGGSIVAQFSPDNAKHYSKVSRTAIQLLELKHKKINNNRTLESFIEIKGPNFNNLKEGEISIPLRAITSISGISGAGKTSLIHLIYRSISEQKAFACSSFQGIEAISSIEFMDRRPILGRNGSFPATFLGVFSKLKDLFGSLREAQILGITGADLSLARKGSRCEECKGVGETSINMKFLSDARVKCPICKGRRYSSMVDAIKYQGKSLPDILNLSISEANVMFANHSNITSKLQAALDLGLGYLNMGQPTASLSGGEAQRLRLATYLSKRTLTGHMILIDEPTTGLHNDDVSRLMECLHKTVEKGSTIVLAEHNSHILKNSDWLVQLGPGAANEGGYVVYQGPSTSHEE